MTVNIVTVVWLVFAIVFFSFPFYMPVTGTSVLIPLLSPPVPYIQHRIECELRLIYGKH